MMHLLIVAPPELIARLMDFAQSSGANHTTCVDADEAQKLLEFASAGHLNIDGVLVEASMGNLDTGTIPSLIAPASESTRFHEFISKLQAGFERESTADEVLLESLRVRWIERAAEYADTLESFGPRKSAEQMREMRRIAHTIRGTADSFGFALIGIAATELEETIDRCGLPEELNAFNIRLLNALREIQDHE